jgi:broad specificity phosphatase PhoE
MPFTRRLFLALGAGLGLGSLGFAQDSRPAPPPEPVTPDAVRKPLVVYAVRHAEKAGGSRDPELTPEGSARATELARVLADVPLAAVYSTQTVRTRSTAGPVAAAAGLAIEAYVPGQLSKLLAAREEGGCVLVVGHSNTVPILLRGLGATYTQRFLKGNDDLFVAVVQEGQPSLVQQLHYGAAPKAVVNEHAPPAQPTSKPTSKPTPKPPAGE